MKRIVSFIITYVFVCAIFCFVLFREYQKDVPENNIPHDVEQEETAQEELVQEESVQENQSINVVHEFVKEQFYYQYSQLNDMEKPIYDKLNRAVKHFETSVDLSSYKCSGDMIEKIYAALMADYPQYFYLTKNCSYSYDSKNQCVKQLLLMYTDGTTTDQYDDYGKRTITANRDVIANKINAFEAKISEFISSIPSDSSALKKEKLIYEFIQSHVSYDMKAAALVDNPTGIQVPHAYDVYGAMCEKNAVCEGYAKLFQYLCYCAGLNSTVVFGTSSGQPHMWNCVEIDNEWYMLDVTWDDSGKENLYCYSYFNLTRSKMSQNHVVDASTLHVPNCVSDTHAFYNQYALYVSDVSSAPLNYQQVLDALVENGDRQLCLYRGNQTGSMQEYIGKQILRNSSEVQQYIASKGYAIELEHSYIEAGEYCYIPLK